MIIICSSNQNSLLSLHYLGSNSNDLCRGFTLSKNHLWKTLTYGPLGINLSKT